MSEPTAPPPPPGAPSVPTGPKWYRKWWGVVLLSVGGLFAAFVALFIAVGVGLAVGAIDPPEKDPELAAAQAAEEEAERQAEEDARRAAEREADRQAEREAEQEAERQAEEEAERRAEVEAERQAEREAERQAEREAEREAKREAERAAEREADRQARRKAEQAARREAESPEARLRKAVESEMRSSNRDVERLALVSVSDGGAVHIKWAINDSLTSNMVRRGARMDATTLLETIRDEGLGGPGVHLEGTYSMQDQYGNVEESTVIRATYDAEVLEKINFDNFRDENVWAIAESAVIHPEFRD